MISDDTCEMRDLNDVANGDDGVSSCSGGGAVDDFEFSASSIEETRFLKPRTSDVSWSSFSLCFSSISTRSPMLFPVLLMVIQQSAR